MPNLYPGLIAKFGSYRLKILLAAIVMLAILLLSQGGEPEMIKVVNTNNLLDLSLIKKTTVKSDKVTGLTKVQLNFKGGYYTAL